jgi:guanylate kinase
VGKGTVVERVLSLRPHLVYSVSCTTREPRPGEAQGVEYLFVSPSEFARLAEEGAFLEWAEVFGHRYGTLLGPIEAALAEGRDVILEIDVQGAAAVRDRVPGAVLVFLVPPSWDELERRLRLRRSETEQELARRLAGARQEMEQAAWFDHVVVNDRIDRAAAEVAAIIDGTSADRKDPTDPAPPDEEQQRHDRTEDR